MSSPPKKMRKSGGGTSAAQAHSEPAVNPSNNDIDMDEDLDPAAMYEDEEGKCILIQHLGAVFSVLEKIWENIRYGI